MTDNSMEARLASIFATVASQVPEEPPMVLLPPKQPFPVTSRRRRRRSLTRTGVAAVTVLAVGGIGGAAAATKTDWLKSFSPQTNVNLKYLAPAFPTGSENPLQVPDAVVHATIPGPEGTTLLLSTAEASNGPHHVGSCWSLTVREKDGTLPPSLPQGYTACSLLSGPGPVGPQPKGFAGDEASSMFTAPSGTAYNVVWGDERPEITTVSLDNNHGVPATTATTQHGWYALYLSHSQFQHFFNLVTYDKSGRRISSVAYGSP